MLTRRPVTEADIPFLLRLRHETMDAHLAASGAVSSEAEHWARLRYRFECAELLVEEGLPVGLLKVARDAADWQIIQIQLAPSLQGRGLGRALLEEVIADAARANAALRLSVLKANPARRLYERLGFEVVGESDFDYQMKFAPDNSSAAITD
jgi:ribosomal protein S18 acetylase RimI-like enzyme